MERKIVFLDIDGVLQPYFANERFDYIDENKNNMAELYERIKAELYKRIKDEEVKDEKGLDIDFSKYNPYDVAAVYCDWNKTSIELLKSILSRTNAQIVLSSGWKNWGFDTMKDFFTIHGLELYYIENTKDIDNINKDWIEETKRKYKEKNGPEAVISPKSLEILEWLHRNPDVKKWVAIDDNKLDGIEEHFVQTRTHFTWKDAEKTFKILTT